jgi:hypothetical protein
VLSGIGVGLDGITATQKAWAGMIDRWYQPFDPAQHLKPMDGGFGKAIAAQTPLAEAARRISQSMSPSWLAGGVGPFRAERPVSAPAFADATAGLPTGHHLAVRDVQRDAATSFATIGKIAKVDWGQQAIADAVAFETRFARQMEAFRRQWEPPSQAWMDAYGASIPRFDMLQSLDLRPFGLDDSLAQLARSLTAPYITEMFTSGRGVTVPQPRETPLDEQVSRLVAEALADLLPGCMETTLSDTEPDGDRLPALAKRGFRMVKEAGIQAGGLGMGMGLEHALLLWAPETHRAANQLISQHQLALMVMTVLGVIRAIIEAGRNRD